MFPATDFGQPDRHHLGRAGGYKNKVQPDRNTIQRLTVQEALSGGSTRQFRTRATPGDKGKGGKKFNPCIHKKSRGQSLSILDPI